ncbi:MAG: hypothetical protein J6I52_03215 [Prevotella sp.]|nr:hypothetical protein [Prevotella sp.]MBP3842436.1 hypothetical protein [Prevotella sp.]
MKKIIYVLAVLFGCATVSFAQTSYIATLQHEGEFTHYYGAGALKSAYNAAQTGDTITLSPGTFDQPSSFHKSITLRGAGVESAEKTYINGSQYFYAESSEIVTTVEGVYFMGGTYIRNNSGTNENGKGTIKFIKCVFSQMYADYGGSAGGYKGPAVRIYNSKVYSQMLFNGYSNPDFMFYNSYVINPCCSSSNFSETTTTFVNCVIEWPYGASSAYYLNFYNSIFNWTYGYYSGSSDSSLLPNTATCYNCLSINKSKLFDRLVSGGNNKTADSVADVFGENKYGNTFELTDAAKETYIGTDGTQIGMQGGNYPYTTTVQYPIITKFNADAQTNKEGMLNVEIEVDGK